MTNVYGKVYGYDCWANEYGPLSPWNSPYQAYACAITQDIGFATERKTTSTTLAARPGQLLPFPGNNAVVVDDQGDGLAAKENKKRLDESITLVMVTVENTIKAYEDAL
jgi:hypothetical protein